MSDDDKTVGLEIKENDPLFYKTLLFINKNKNKDTLDRTSTRKDTLEYLFSIIKKIAKDSKEKTKFKDCFILINTGEKAMTMAWNILISYINGKLRDGCPDENFLLQTIGYVHNANFYIGAVFVPIPQDVNLTSPQEEGEFLYKEMKDVYGHNELKSYVKGKFGYEY